MGAGGWAAGEGTCLGRKGGTTSPEHRGAAAEASHRAGTARRGQAAVPSLTSPENSRATYRRVFWRAGWWLSQIREKEVGKE